MHFPQDWRKHPKLNLWSPSSDNAEAFKYSDGAEKERYIKESVAEVSDLSSTSAELVKKIKDWPSEYHFTPKRANLMRPLTLSGCQSILELGCGCGAITRYLGEQSPRVVAVEGSKERAEIAASRCRDLPHVDVICSNFQDVEFQQKFDAVTLIGVFEYSAVYFQGNDPYMDVLRMTHGRLTDDGVLILAIENKLGLKYLAGAPEDHSGLLFDGIEGYPSGKPVRTFGKRELENMLRAAGFSSFEFLYPFPDYKLPEMVLRSDPTQNDPSRPELYQWLSFDDPRDSAEWGITMYSKYLAAKEMEANGLLGDTANSFMVIAGKNAQAVSKVVGHEPDWLVQKFNVERSNAYSTKVCLHKSNEGYKISTSYLCPSATKPASTNLKHTLEERTYIAGANLMEHMLRALRKKSAEKESLQQLLLRWQQVLCAGSNDGGKTVPGNYVDCTPWNLIETADGQLVYIDREWSFQDSLPVEYILFRGLTGIYQNAAPWLDSALDLERISPWQFVELGFNLLERKISVDGFRQFLQTEWEFKRQVNLVPAPTFETWFEKVNSAFNARVQITKVLDRRNWQLRQAEENLVGAKQAVDAINRSRIWKLRNIYRRARSFTRL